jgi:hypothetical protein
MSAVAQAALRYADRGWPAFPCRGKAPLTVNGLHAATTDEERIRRWWRQWPDANVAIRTGAVSNLVVLDVDGDEGTEALRRLEAEHGKLPLTASVVTPRGGEHYYWRHPGGEVRNSTGRIGDHLDVRGDGGYVLAPPSISASGRRYEPDERASVAPMPSWLRTLITSPQDERAKHPEPVETWIRMVHDGLVDGERNHGLARLVGHLLAKDVHAHLVAELAHLVNSRGRPPLDTSEVDRIVASIAGCDIRRRTGGRR